VKTVHVREGVGGQGCRWSGGPAIIMAIIIITTIIIIITAKKYFIIISIIQRADFLHIRPDKRCLEINTRATRPLY